MGNARELLKNIGKSYKALPKHQKRQLIEPAFAIGVASSVAISMGIWAPTAFAAVKQEDEEESYSIAESIEEWVVSNPLANVSATGYYVNYLDYRNTSLQTNGLSLPALSDEQSRWIKVSTHPEVPNEFTMCTYVGLLNTARYGFDSWTGNIHAYDTTDEECA